MNKENDIPEILRIERQQNNESGANKYLITYKYSSKHGQKFMNVDLDTLILLLRNIQYLGNSSPTGGFVADMDEEYKRLVQENLRLKMENEKLKNDNNSLKNIINEYENNNSNDDVDSSEGMGIE